MRWHRLYGESKETQTIPVEVSMREVKLIQNYLNKGKSLNDPSNKECLNTVLRILNDLVKNSNAEELDTYISNFFYENFGI
jgi:chorismate mutase